MKKTRLFIINKDLAWNKIMNDYFKERYDLLQENDRERVIDKFFEYNTEIDYIIIGDRYPDYKTRQIIQGIRGYSKVPIFLMAENMDEETQALMYKAGADDYTSYYLSPHILEFKIEAYNKRFLRRNDLIEEGILELNPFRKKIKVNGKEVAITAKEFELLYYLVVNKKVIQTRDQILSAVWGINYMGNDRVVDSLVKKLRNKMGEASSYIKTVYAMGYYFEAPEKEEEVN